MQKGKSILVTGAAGFIGFHLAKRLLDLGHEVVGLDNLNDYYDVNLKRDRLALLKTSSRFRFNLLDVTDKKGIDTLFTSESFHIVVNLAAQAGVRHSLTHPYTYIDTNVTGFLNILEACRRNMPEHLVFASSSSVYGGNQKSPFSTRDNVDHPLALYAASKKANELMAHAYSNLYGIPVTGLRFFSAYGTFGRPDMALFMFTRAILNREPIDVYNFGRMRRDFTYVDDIVEGIIGLMQHVPVENKSWNAVTADPATSWAPYRIFNIGNNAPVELGYFIEVLEQKLGARAIKNFLPMQTGDVSNSESDIEDLKKLIGFTPRISVETGISLFVDWYRDYYHV